MVQRVLQWERQKRCSSSRDPWQRNVVIIIIRIVGGEEKMKTREDRMVRLEFLFSKLSFWTYIKKMNPFTCWVHGHMPLGPHSVYT